MNEQQISDLQDMKKALYGNPETGELGIVQMTKEMYQAWSAIIWFGKAVTALAVFCAAIGTAWVAFGGLIKRILQRLSN